MISLDTETTGLDFHHGATPFFITCAMDDAPDGKVYQKWWEWKVDPRTRRVQVDPFDLDDIRELVRTADRLILQNSKFDVQALGTLDRWFIDNWPWDRTEDTLVAGHVIASNHRHNLTDMAIEYLNVNIEPVEKEMEKIVQKCRRDASKWEGWAIAKAGRKDMPSAKEKTWKFDSWLPRAVADRLQYPESHEYRTVTAEYANTDSATTLYLWKAQKAEIEKQGLWKIYRERMRLPEIFVDMEQRGVTEAKSYHDALKSEYQQEEQDAIRKCVNIAASLGYNLTVPKGGNNKSLMEFCFGPPMTLEVDGKVIETDESQRVVSPHCLNMPIISSTDKGNPSLDKSTLDEYEVRLPKGSKALSFVRALKAVRKKGTSVKYLEGYERFRLPLPYKGIRKGKPYLNDKGHVLADCSCGLDSCPICDWGAGICEKCGAAECELADPCSEAEWFVLHPNYNQCATDTLRASSSNPNAQNVDKHPDNKGYSLRSCFGPAPGREWWSLDAQNVELRIPAFESGEKDLIYVFEHPKEAPYFGSYHLFVADILFPELFKQWGKDFKDEFASTWYQWIKNGNFAVIYGAQEDTADRTYHCPGAFKKIRHRFPRIAGLADRQIALANKLGYVETIPDKSVDPKRGYPLLCSRSDWGKIVPTVPLNYHIQGTAMWWTARAMVRTYAQIKEWRTKGFDGYLCLQVHDELVFDLPKRGHPKADADKEKATQAALSQKTSPKAAFRTSNLWRIRAIQRLMEKGGEGIGVPTPVSCKYHNESWAVGESL